jgi:phosphopantetheinyl transferase (holo-ACP synthase)
MSHRVSLKEYLEALLAEKDLRNQQRFDAQSQAIFAAFAAAKEAVTKAEIATEKRFESVNEFRAALTDQNARQVSLIQFEGLRDTLNERIASITGRLDRNDGKGMGLNAGWGYLVGAIGIGLAVAMFFVR